MLLANDKLNKIIFFTTFCILSWSSYLFIGDSFYAVINYKNASLGECPTDELILARELSDAVSNNYSRTHVKIISIDGSCTYRITSSNEQSIQEAINSLDNIVNKGVEEQNKKFEICNVIFGAINPSNSMLVELFNNKATGHMRYFETVDTAMRYYVNNCNFKNNRKNEKLIHDVYSIRKAELSYKSLALALVSTIAITFSLILFL